MASEAKVKSIYRGTDSKFTSHLGILIKIKVRQVVMDLGWVDFDFNIPSSCPAPLLGQLDVGQNGAGSGMPKINVNPT